MANSFSTKAPGETAGTAAPIKQAPASAPVKPAPVRTEAPMPTVPAYMNEPRRSAPTGVRMAQPAPPFPPAGPQLDEFGRDTSAFLASTKTPMAAVGDFNQRKANAAMMQPGAAPPAAPGTGGGFMAGPPPGSFGPPQDGGGLGQGGQPGAGPMPGNDFNQPRGGPMQPPPGFQQMLQNPNFMQWLMRMFQGQQGAGPQSGPAGSPPQPQFGPPMQQGPPR
jgi:hypothetical protein